MPETIQRYASICNVALYKNAARFPFKQILSAAERTTHGRAVEVEIADQGKVEDTKYVFRLAQGRIHVEAHTCGKSCRCDGTWRVDKSYLDSVINNAPAYIENPALINWDWLYTKN